ncbi:hypothetical protein IscW_ISCW005982 [Ixodes scapularis]|uniref:Uncharacterized protein n=1 Tax=Ixodes scapularis TaxID=6945 RepID=B7PNX2_IXOSC|nr:hypothetical protein IscW_ISCW005982 [Ixodes scapularis]|eukprot:XP_002435464.1 hypothetical protein IscW_ISCW005982 [Ixodes scapularis]
MLYSSLSSPLPSCNTVLRNRRPLTLLHSEKTFATHYKKKGIMHDDMIDFFAHAPTRHEPRRKTGTFQGAAFTGFIPQSSIRGAQLKEKSGKKKKEARHDSGVFGCLSRLVPHLPRPWNARLTPLCTLQALAMCTMHASESAGHRCVCKAGNPQLKSKQKIHLAKKMRQTLYSLNSCSTVGKTARKKISKGALTADPRESI